MSGHCLCKLIMCQRYRFRSSCMQHCHQCCIKVVAKCFTFEIRRTPKTSSRKVRRCSYVLRGSIDATSSPSKKVLPTPGVHRQHSHLACSNYGLFAACRFSAHDCSLTHSDLSLSPAQCADLHHCLYCQDSAVSMSCNKQYIHLAANAGRIHKSHAKFAG